MPDKWTKRMHTIETYEEDTSATSRLTTWKTLWNLALDRPIVGAGFETGSQEIFQRYAPKDVAWTGLSRGCGGDPCAPARACRHR